MASENPYGSVPVGNADPPSGRRLSWRRLTCIGVLMIVAPVLINRCADMFLPAWPSMAYSVSISGDGRIAAVGSHHGRLSLIRVDDGQSHGGPYGGREEIQRVCLNYRGDLAVLWARFAANGTTDIAAVVDVRDTPFRLLAVEDRESSPAVEFADRAGSWVRVDRAFISRTLSVSRGEDTLYLNESDLTLRNASDDTIFRRLTLPGLAVKVEWVSGTWTMDGTAAAAFVAGKLVVWRAPDWDPRTVRHPEWGSAAGCGNVRGMRLRDENTNLFILCESGVAIVLDVATGEKVWSEDVNPGVPFQGIIGAIDESADRFIVSNSHGRKVFIWQRDGLGYKLMRSFATDELVGLEPWTKWAQLGRDASPQLLVPPFQQRQ